MAIDTKTGTSGSFTIDISTGTQQEVADWVASLLKDRRWNIDFWVLGFTMFYVGQAYQVCVLMKYITTP